ncbi:hypothetical protein Gasu2_66220 [Galdieria sulphuraria]|uniref:SAP domain-containing protein n=1 Tax=Galdieria sulphuraria TaxID=130081 RepID=M2VYK3_GALSU|nr:uncharacterized protein Gasu_42000 [Galdieria sulphuraria]EME28361.1 hypothetical protein Gasu_42000 [Galdieria sulphuraria]GJD12544.1 hypothetical protein Gasu2_66220 [Galdieria sulphuraria]|eukprot:XP_005704881.1 hypothetical protein Gasu_42000 [Galdieria sulphuraria]
MESFNKQTYETTSNFDINTAAELLTSLQDGKTDAVLFDSKGKRKLEENANVELLSMPTKNHEQLPNKVPREQNISPNCNNCSSTTSLIRNGKQTKSGDSDSLPVPKSKSVVSTPVRKRTRAVSGFEDSPPSVQKRQQGMTNMFAVEWAFLQQLKWCQSKENYYSGWLSPLPYYQNLWSCASVPREQKVTKSQESLKSSKGRPPSELPLSRMRFKALQQACVDRGISPNGTVAALKQRLRDWVSVKMTGKPSVPQQRKRRIENEHPAIQDYKTV